ncbi:tetratricopeptide repeat protein, partial [Candidatus Chloroploca sp. M-50]
LAEALAIKTAVLGRQHRSTAVTLYELGRVTQAEGDYPAARQSLTEALAIHEAVLGHQHRDTAFTLHNLGVVAQAEGDYPAARQCFQEALAIYEAVLGRQHRDTAVTLHELGRVAQAEGDYPAARQYLAEALAIKTAVLGRQHRETAVTLHELGNVAQAEDDYPAARQSFQEALAIKTAVLGRQHRSTQITAQALRDLRFEAVENTAWCAGLSWLLLPWLSGLIAAVAILSMGWLGYWKFHLATRSVHILLRVLLGLGAAQMLLWLTGQLFGDLPISVIYLAQIIGASIGIAWPWLRSRLRRKQTRGNRTHP